MIKHQMFIAAALLVGVAIGYFVKNEPIAAEGPSVEEKAKKPVADKGEEASVKALRHRVAELEKLLADKGGASQAAIPNAAAEAAKIHPPEPPRGTWRERMEEMKKNDPERFAQMTNRLAQWRSRRATEARDRIDFLSSIDTSSMSAAAKKTHEALQDLIARREELERQMHQPNLSDEERGQLMHELHVTHRELMRLNGEERSNLLEETARSLGFEGEDAKVITDTIQQVIEATDSGFGFRPGGPHGGGPRGPGGPGGR